MILDVKVPTVAESVTEVVVAKWLKNEGEKVTMNEIICELDSDKASFELSAETDGIISILVREGETVGVGETICQIQTQNTTNVAQELLSTNTAQEIINHSNNNMETTQSTTSEVKEMRVVPFAESITEVTIGTWLKNEGDFVNQDEPICEVETDKATQELTAEFSGTLQIVAATGSLLKIGDLICKIAVGAAPAQKASQNETQTNTTNAQQNTTTSSNHNQNNDTYASGHPSPAATKILAEKGISPDEVKGSGIDGRITKQDAVDAQKTATQSNEVTTTTTQQTSQPASIVSSNETSSRAQRRERMTPLRKTVARRLVAVKNQTAMLTTFNEVNMLPIMELRKKFKDKFKEKYNVGLGFMSFFVKACCIALKEYPQVNAMIDGEDIVFNDFCDVSIAVSAPKGLVVPVVRNAEAMSFAQIEKAIEDLATKARNNKLSIPEMEGGTFTITNGGVFGSLMSTPIINAPQSAILGMHNIVERPVVVNGEIVIRPMMYIALSYDHRIIDGRESVSFLVRVKQILEEPERLLFGV
ncbi:MAG: 2-oxoglutarate dehydrogenase complex dihydrolipoyllysine-residue succinyltransferase [Cytophagales bacterium]|nr:MAG: 2-oxoglutarate dehydrogenase complex dihydrolipoyllysine-residue succinyltransferase [Cytophagales bacterium]